MTLPDHEPTTVAAFNEATGANIDERIIVEALVELQEQGWLSDARPALTEDETSFLDEHGGVHDNREALIKSRVAARGRAAALSRETMTVAQVAELLRISASRVRHRLAERTIYSYPSRGRGAARQIPRWQFHDRRAVPHLAEVLDALPPDFSAVEVRDFVVNAEIDRPTREGSVPLLDWLLSDGDPEPAVELAEAQAYLV